MKPPPLKQAEMAMVHDVFRRHPEIATATLFGSRAKGTHSERSDVDLVVTGDVPPLQAESIAAELEELPLLYRFEIQPLAHIRDGPLLDHIRRIGNQIYPAL